MSDNYQMCFPFDDVARGQGYDWFIDKEQQRYVTIGLPPEIDDEDYFVELSNSEDQDHISITTESSDSTDSQIDSADKLADEFQSKVKLEDTDFADFYRQEMMNLHGRKMWFVSHCVLKETAKVRHMLHQYKKDRLHNDRDRYGNDVMSLVAMEGHVCIMELLHDEGTGISNVNARGRTPLMEAALWGRDDAVKFLLEKGADSQLKDHKYRTALDLAQDTDQNKREREARSRMYRDSQDLRYARIRICARLERLTSAISLMQRPVQNLATFFSGHFQQAGLDLAWYDRTISYGLDYDTRTVGLLSCNPHVPVISAMSGSNHHLPHPQTLDNRTWTLKVRDLCAVIGFGLHSHPRDHLFVGSYNACHAEKQLATYYIDQHFLWGDELRDPDVKELQRMRPIGSPPKASIAVNRPGCPDCKAFLRHVQVEFVVEIDVQERTGSEERGRALGTRN
jgi:Ankyrin repeats (3 copies)